MSEDTRIPASERLRRKAAVAYAKGNFREAAELAEAAHAAHWQECVADYHRGRAERGEREPD